MSRLSNFRVLLVACLMAAFLVALTAPLLAQRAQRIDPPTADDIATPPADEGADAQEIGAADDELSAAPAAAQEGALEEMDAMAGANDVSLAQAHAAIEAAVEKARELDTKMDIAIVDAGGNLKAFVRMDGAWLGSIDISIRKAKTARWFDMDTGEIGKLSQPGGPLFGIEHSNEGLITFPGGIPLRSGDTVIGAIGVSGSTVENDHEVAQAGAQAIAGGENAGEDGEAGVDDRGERGERRQPRRIERRGGIQDREGEGRNAPGTAKGEGSGRQKLPPTE